VKLRPLAYCVLATVSSASAAHDFWIQPLQWQNSGEVAVTLQVAHGNDRQRSPVEVSRIVLVKSILAVGQRVDPILVLTSAKRKAISQPEEAEARQ